MRGDIANKREIKMPTATDFLNAFRHGFREKDASQLDALTTDDFVFTSISSGTHRSKTEALEWLVSGDCLSIDDYVIIHDTDDCIAGTHSGSGKDWTVNAFFFAKKVNGKASEWYVTGVSVNK